MEAAAAAAAADKILREASKRVYWNVRGMAGTSDAVVGDYGTGAGGDISRNIDIVAEQTVLDCLKEANFGCVVLGEECGRVEIPGEGSGGCIIMDAVDGSANAVRGVPFFCCSLAFAPHGDKLSDITFGVVTNLTNGQMCWASKGNGAFADGARIHVRTEDPIYKIVGVNMSGASKDLVAQMYPVFESDNHIRHFGASALEMALFARGMLDALVDLRDRIRIHDIAAGYIIVKEAGGLLLDSNLNPLDAKFGYDARISFVAATNQSVLDIITPEIGLG